MKCRRNAFRRIQKSAEADRRTRQQPEGLTLTLPVGLFTCITGVSGSGKSTLINDTLFPIAQRQLNGATIAEPAPYRDIQGLEHFDKVIDIDQSPIGRTPRSNPATYTGVFTPVRELFAGVPDPVRVVIRQDVSALMSVAGAAKPVRATV